MYCLRLALLLSTWVLVGWSVPSFHRFILWCSTSWYAGSVRSRRRLGHPPSKTDLHCPTFQTGEEVQVDHQAWGQEFQLVSFYGGTHDPVSGEVFGVGGDGAGGMCAQRGADDVAVGVLPDGDRQETGKTSQASAHQRTHHTQAPQGHVGSRHKGLCCKSQGYPWKSPFDMFKWYLEGEFKIYRDGVPCICLVCTLLTTWVVHVFPVCVREQLFCVTCSGNEHVEHVTLRDTHALAHIFYTHTRSFSCTHMHTHLHIFNTPMQLRTYTHTHFLTHLHTALHTHVLLGYTLYTHSPSHLHLYFASSVAVFVLVCSCTSAQKRCAAATLSLN